MNECYECKFRDNVPGSAHSQCKFNWRKYPKEHIPQCESSYGRQWFNFPYNFDPTWGDKCNVPSNKNYTDEDNVTFSPMEEIASILG